MIRKIDFKFAIAGLALIATTVLMATGDVQKVITFRDVINEIFFTGAVGALGLICLGLSGK